MIKQILFSKIVIPFDIYEKVLDIGFKKEDITLVEPDNFYEIDEIKFSTVRAYNINKNFHLKESNWVGYILKLNNFKYYIAGDTDITEENKKINCDVAFIPIGGTYTMDYLEAAQLTNIIKPKVVVPIHYGSIVGNSLDCEKFKHLVNKDIECRVMF